MGTAVDLSAQLPPLLEQFCGKCHSGKDAEAGFEVASLFVGDTQQPRRIAEALEHLRGRAMPPADEPQPSDAQRAALIALLASQLPSAPDARVATARRLSRGEYARTVTRLLHVPFDGAGDLPDDPALSGFDNQGDVLAVTPLHFEKYLDAAERLTRLVLADAEARTRTFGDASDVALRSLLERAFRRPIRDEELTSRRTLLDRHAVDGADLGLAAVLRSILVSPSFLFRIEFGQPDARHLLTAHELAVRLSYMLQGSMPDPALFAAADGGELSSAANLRAHARRLLAEDGARAFAEQFAAQWLRLREALVAPIDYRRYPEIWNQRLRPALHEEALQLFAAVVRDDLSILTLLDADFTFVNRTLAKHYGLPDVKGDAFVRVPLADRRRGGLLGMGAMSIVTSYPLRTSPVLRGKWILDQLLDAPPPPPPANAGTLPPDDQHKDGLTLRQRLERHRRDRACATCHAQIDPLGFALENYDALGRWRDQIHGVPVDARATLPDGTALDGPIALKDALLARKADFARSLAKKLATHAIGRELLPADEPDIATIVQSTIAGDYRFSALLDALLASPLFSWRDPAHIEGTRR